MACGVEIVKNRIRQQYLIVLSNAGSKAIFRRNQPIFSAEYWFYKTAFDLPMKK